MSKSQKLLHFYYYVTPIFAILEWAYGIKLRVRIPLEYEFITYLYYTICFLCAFLLTKYTKLASIIILFECILNLLLLIITLILPYILIIDNVGSPSFNQDYYSKYDMYHFLIAAIMLLLCFYSNPIIKNSRKF